VEERGILAINRPGLSVGVRLGLVRIEDLDLKLAHQKYAAIAAVLTLAPRGVRRCPFDVELDVAELLLGLDRPPPRYGLHPAIGQPPSGRSAPGGLPLIEIRAIKEHD